MAGLNHEGNPRLTGHDKNLGPEFFRNPRKSKTTTSAAPRTDGFATDAAIILLPTRPIGGAFFPDSGDGKVEERMINQVKIQLAIMVDQDCLLG